MMTRCLLTTCICLLSVTVASAQQYGLEDMSLERWAKLREVERHQLQIAEKYYREKKWAVAISEYDKYLSLYERSDAASYSMLKWSLAHIQLRKANTAIRDGFQSVVDYWPDSPDAVAAAYFIARTYKDIGQLKKAKSEYRKVLAKHPKHLAAVRTMADLIDVSNVEKDEKTRVEMWKRLTFDVPRTKQTRTLCARAAQQLSAFQFEAGAFDEAVTALATTYNEVDLPEQVFAYARAPIGRLIASSETETKGRRLADALIAYLKSAAPDGTEEEAQTRAKQMWYLIAETEMLARRQARVAEVFQQIIKQFGVDDVTLGRLAAWQKSQTEFEQARATYRKFKDQLEGLNQVANSYRQEKNYAAAVRTYGQLAGQDAENAARWQAEAAMTHREAKAYPQAIAIYEGLMKTDVENADRWLWELATCYRDSGKDKEAVAYYRQSNNFPENYKQMAACHRRLKQYNEAIVLYNQIVGGHAASAPWATLQIAYTREQAGQKEPAIKSFQEVCRKYPKDSHASAAHAHLQTKYKISVTLGGVKDE
ncbi:MAG TPA: hypothetical protein DCY79_16695 [Planctomycetaceae bacterium]|nr:hypothetical protein [Blastopirellula sp.]HAY81444.1 hypothetical protein [Planctomycetaceae bacterium]